jgi:hypothetical protein
MAIICQILLKVIFNVFSTTKVMIDKWTILDCLCAVLNIIATYLIVSVPKEIYLPSKPDPFLKDFVDYFMILVLVITWLRFFVYFLVVR